MRKSLLLLYLVPVIFAMLLAIAFVRTTDGYQRAETSKAIIIVNTLLLPIFLITLTAFIASKENFWVPMLLCIGCAVICPNIYNAFWVITSGYSAVKNYYAHDGISKLIYLIQFVTPCVLVFIFSVIQFIRLKLIK